MKQGSEYYSTMGAIAISMVDFGLHCLVGLWLTSNYWGDHQRFWAFIVLALMANLIGICVYIARNVGDVSTSTAPPTGVSRAELSEFSMKLQQRPNEAVMVLLFSMVNTECLCFLTRSETAHNSFRKLDVLRTLIEDLPLTFIMLAFLYEVCPRATCPGARTPHPALAGGCAWQRAGCVRARWARRTRVPCLRPP